MTVNPTPDNGERVYLSLGGNLGDPASSMAAALRMLDADAQIAVIKVSSLYRTPPWGKLDQPDFLNAVAVLSTSLSPHDLLDKCLHAERTLKRVRQERWGPRLIDIDVLVFGDRVVNERGLEVPHPRMLDRAFVLVPLNEVAPDLFVRGQAVSERLAEIDHAGIEKLPSGRDWWKA
ncbi:2-amino-4-hydroxy-6-hydroxymethyldihydropteridine diphosphokinase [Pseudaminobacter sp. NGMCC 1.201702]|uniref:2-amino-4-hydroxy-6- hydroxymethyldihydropteridine diphosphokinase n=1 Tax=Pseudaminobacter sp. NGMCC 1.201702 TaxID=3391825 RepID=UPI0039EDFA4E